MSHTTEGARERTVEKAKAHRSTKERGKGRKEAKGEKGARESSTGSATIAASGDTAKDGASRGWRRNSEEKDPPTSWRRGPKTSPRGKGSWKPWRSVLVSAGLGDA